jgi:hypothetical protein
VNPKLVAALATLFSVVWAFSMVWDALTTGYDPPAAIHGIPTLIVGGLISVHLRKSSA